MPIRPKLFPKRFAWVLLPHPSIPSKLMNTPCFIFSLSLNLLTRSLRCATLSQNEGAHKICEQGLVSMNSATVEAENTGLVILLTKEKK
jgi:hypothetical protein